MIDQTNLGTIYRRMRLHWVGNLILVVFSVPPSPFHHSRMHAQEPDRRPEFEVASIKPSTPSPLPGTVLPGMRNGRLVASNTTLMQMLQAAYGLAAQRIIGPDWLDKERFDLQAKAAPGVPDTQKGELLQRLLEDRFQLKVHRELRETPVYDLVVAKGGIKMPVFPKPAPASKNAVAPGYPVIIATQTMSEFCVILSRVAERPVIDTTDLTERYSIILRFSRPSSQTDRNDLESGPPDLFTALQEQLGLKLQPSRNKLEVIVVDHIERTPSEN